MYICERTFEPSTSGICDEVKTQVPGRKDVQGKAGVQLLMEVAECQEKSAHFTGNAINLSIMD